MISVYSWWFFFRAECEKGLQHHQGLTRKLIYIAIIKLNSKKKNVST